MPQDIVSDRDAKFTSKAWKDFCKTFYIYQSTSTAYHPRTDGQSEVANKPIIQQIKKMVHEGDSNCLGQLRHIQSILNRIRSSSRNATPYEIIIGHNPRLIGDMLVKIPTQEETPTQRISRINQTQEIVRKCLQDAKISTDNYFHRPDFWNLSWNTSTVFGIGHCGQLPQDQFFPAVLLVPLDKLSLYSLLKHLQFVVLTVLHLLSHREYLPAPGAEIASRTGVVARAGW